MLALGSPELVRQLVCDVNEESALLCFRLLMLALGSPLGHKMASDNGFKMHPRWPEAGPGWTQTGPKMAPADGLDTIEN